mmetsp:Transcript_66589/g.160752  ORF Transcript_66589/g.160752 Transcript_66589/m.160752 type:complete len:189 (-) Transcript_66589:207-773(-)
MPGPVPPTHGALGVQLGHRVQLQLRPDEHDVHDRVHGRRPHRQRRQVLQQQLARAGRRDHRCPELVVRREQHWSSNTMSWGNSGFKICTSPSAWPSPEPSPVACLFTPQADWVQSAISVTGGTYANEVSWTLSCVGMCDIQGGAPYGQAGAGMHSVPPGAACTLAMEDSYGDGWNGNEVCSRLDRHDV